MLKREYHCFVAGLADLVFDGSKGFINMNEFREELKEILHPKDYLLVSILFLPHDNKNIISFLNGEKYTWDSLGNYSHDDFEEQKSIIHAIISEKNILPAYMVELMTEWYDPEKSIEKNKVEKILSEGYIGAALDSGNGFLNSWIRYERDMNNIFTLINSKPLGLDAGKIIVGDDPLANELKEISDRGKNFSIPSEPGYAPEIFKIATDLEFLERERTIDLARWNFIDTITFFEYFTIDLIMGYLIKLSIVLRWKQLDPETGEIMLKKLIDDIKAPALIGNLAVK